MEGGDSIVLEEEIDPNYEPTEKEVLEYATWLGMNLEGEHDLFWIAREGLKAPLPENWKPCKTKDTDEIYYFNFASGQSTWDHPCDEFYRNLYEEHKKKLHTKDGREPDEKKKKAQEDVAELLGRKKCGKKKKGFLNKAEPLGGPTLRNSNDLEMKPPAGLTSKLESIGGGGLKPVAGLGPRTSKAKDLTEFGIGLDNIMDNLKSIAPVNLLSETPLGFSLRKYPQLTPSSTMAMKGGELKSNDNEILKEKREQLGQDHARLLRKIQDTHASDLEALQIKLKAQLEDVQDAEEMKLKQLKRELEKKKIIMENRFDQQENALKRNRNDQLKRLDAEIENSSRQKKEELDRDSKAEIEKMRLRHEAKQRGIQKKFEQEAKEFKEMMISEYGERREAAQLVSKLKAEIEQLHDQQKSLELELKTTLSEKQTLLRVNVSAENERNSAQCEVKDLQKQLSCCADLLPESCPQCSALEDQNAFLNEKCIEAQNQVEKLRKEHLTLQQECHDAKRANTELVQNIHNQEAASKLETAKLLDKVASLTTESSERQSKCASYQSKIFVVGQEKDSFTLERKDGQLISLQKQLVAAQAEAANTKIELQSLQSQHSVTLLEKLQLEEHLVNEANERNDPSKQLETKNDEHSEVINYEQYLQTLQQQLDIELRIRQELEDTCDALREEISALKQKNCCLDAKVSQLESDSRLFNDVSSDSEEGLDLSGLKNKVESLQQEPSNLGLKSLCAANKLPKHHSGATFKLNRLDHHETEKFKHLAEINEEEKDECTQCSILEARVLSLKSERSEHQIELNNVQNELAELKKGTTAEEEKVMVNTANLQQEMDNVATKFQYQETRIKREIIRLPQKLSTPEPSTELKDKCDSIRAEKNNASEHESDTSSSASVMQEQVQFLERQLIASNAEIASTKADLYDPQIDRQNLLMANEQTKEKMAKESNEIKRIRKRLDAKTEEVAQRLADATKTHQEQLLNIQQKVDKESRIRREQENVCEKLREELSTMDHSKRKVDAQLDQLESDKSLMESEKAMLVLHLDDMNLTQKRDEKSVVSIENSLAKKNLYIEELRESLQLVELDKAHFETRVIALAHDLEQLQTKMRRLETEYEKERAQSRSRFIERDLALQREQKFVDELESIQRKDRSLSTDISDLQSQLCKAKLNEQVAAKNEEQCDQKLHQLEEQRECNEFALKMKPEHAEVEYASILVVKEKAEITIKAMEKELETAMTRKESELQALQAQDKPLLREKDESQGALSNTNNASEATTSVTRESATSNSANMDVTLDKLQLANTNSTELNAPFANTLSQQDTSIRRCVIMEARCRDQSVEIESLHIEVAWLRSVSLKVHSSALELLTLDERLEYEHKKRILRGEFMKQLRDFQHQEEQALVQHKARLRAQYERQVDDVRAELEKTWHQRLEQEEMLSYQMLQQMRHETDIKQNEAKKQMRAEILQLEDELNERKALEIDSIVKAIKREKDELGTRLRDICQETSEKALAEQHKSIPDNAQGQSLRIHRTSASPGKLIHRPTKMKNEAEEDDGGLTSAHFIKTQDRRHNTHAKIYQKWKWRLQEEINVLVNARNLVANQRHGLAKQKQQLQNSKNEWIRKSRVSKADPIQRKVKRMFDENMTNWSEGMQKLVKQEVWVKQREPIVAKMKRTVNRLRQGLTKRNNNTIGTSSDDEDELCGKWSNHSNSKQLASTLDKLEQLEDELAFDAGNVSEEAHMKCDDDFHTVYHASPSYIVQREGTYGYLSLDHYVPRRATRDSAGPEMRWIRSQRGFGLRGKCFELEPTARSATQAEQIYQQKISRWAKGREKVQHAATNHAIWLSGLCEELREYGAKYTKTVEELKDLSDDSRVAQVEGVLGA